MNQCLINHQVPVANAHTERENSLQKNLLEEFDSNLNLYIAFFLSINELILSERIVILKTEFR